MAKKKGSSLGRLRAKETHGYNLGGTYVSFTGAEGSRGSRLIYKNYDQGRSDPYNTSLPYGTKRTAKYYDFDTDEESNDNGEIKISDATRDVMRARSEKRTWKNDRYTTRPHSTDPKRDRAYALAAG